MPHTLLRFHPTALLSSDGDNLYLVLTARLVNPSVFILSKAMDEEAERKILQVGANKAVNFNPSPEIKIETDNILLVLGDEQAITKFENVYISH